MRKDWILCPVDAAAVQQLAGQLEVSPLIARVLINRGFGSPGSAERFLCADLGLLGSPEQMADLPAAVDLIRQTIERKEKILIVGDYDADGLTGSALLFHVIRSLGGQVTCHIPHRVDDGYGLKSAVIEKAHRSDVKLLITVDCGTSSFDELEFARKLGIQTVVVDHHDLDPHRKLAASAFLNPLRPDCSYPEKELASVGVAFTLARGLASACGDSREVWEHLDLVAIGTVADLAPLSGENRILVKAGLHCLRGTRKPGLRALLSAVGLEGKALGAEDVSFKLAPPLNAAGRLGSAEISFRLLTTDDPQEAEQMAKAICCDNRARRTLEREAFKRALAKVAREINFSQDRVIVLEDEGWHPGVVGILATRLANRFHRPTVVIALNGPICRGSARSIRAFNLVEALHAVKEELVEFGGHPGAAGLTIERSRIAAFREALNRVAHERLDRGSLSPMVDLDGELPLSDLTEEFIRDLEVLAPFGMGNAHPVFLSCDARISVGAGPAGFSPFGVRIIVESPQGHSFEALHPRETVWDSLNLRKIRGNVHLAYSPTRRRDADQFKIELRLRDLKLPTSSA